MEGDSEVDKCWLKDGSQPDDTVTDDERTLYHPHTECLREISAIGKIEGTKKINRHFYD